MYDHVFSPLSKNLFEIGNFTITFYAMAILSGIIVALWLAYKEIDKLGMDPDDLSDGFSYGLILSILGARAYYVVMDWWQNPGSYNDFVDVIAIWNGGMAIHGAIIAVAVFLYFYTKRRNLNIFKFLEVLVPGFLLAQGIGRWGNFMNQEAHGGLVPGFDLDARREFLAQTLKLPEFIVNQMYLYGPNGLNYYHPTFLYESLWNLVGFIIMFVVLRKIKKYWVGEALSFYLVWYSMGRFFIEGMRTDSLYLWGTDIRVAQAISILMALMGIAWFVFRRMKKLYPVSYRDYVETRRANKQDAADEEVVSEEE